MKRWTPVCIYENNEPTAAMSENNGDGEYIRFEDLVGFMSLVSTCIENTMNSGDFITEDESVLYDILFPNQKGGDDE